MGLKLYYDLLSQPARSLYILLKSANFNFESKEVKLGRLDHRTPEFAAINRFQKIPVIDHDGFILSESVAIARYLSRENIIPDKLYPKEPKAKARVDEFLEWHHINLRLHCTMFVMEKVVKPLATKQPPNEKIVETFRNHMVDALTTFEEKWLDNGTQFIAGDEVTVADLFAANEVEQPKLCGYNPMENFEKIGSWHKKVQEYFNPHFDEAHVIFIKAVEKAKAKASK